MMELFYINIRNDNTFLTFHSGRFIESSSGSEECSPSVYERQGEKTDGKCGENDGKWERYRKSIRGQGSRGWNEGHEEDYPFKHYGNLLPTDSDRTTRSNQRGILFADEDAALAAALQAIER